ncbi:hypothetical protein ACFRMN_26610 [Streptomyces sp. NPDC056835]|uniref:hypothetical protein n=1 Tax=Streptomyces sp. NPDC056835 TaxID=3345956 RepID=UPI0036BFFC04
MTPTKTAETTGGQPPPASPARIRPSGDAEDAPIDEACRDRRQPAFRERFVTSGATFGFLSNRKSSNRLGPGDFAARTGRRRISEPENPARVRKGRPETEHQLTRRR